MLIQITEKEFKDKVEIRFSNITEGFNKFNNRTLEDLENINTEEKMINFTIEAFELNGEENSYVDFYYNVLKDEDKNRLRNLLSDEDKDFLDRFIEQNNDNNEIYYRLTKESIPFITRLNTKENLFCTIYFTKEPCTIWGNYNIKFPLLYKSKDVLNKYYKIAKKCNLVVQ